MKKITSLILALALCVCALFTITSCGQDQIIVDTNAFFAPFEYYEGEQIVGVDVEIMEKVGQKLGKKVVFENTDFSVIIDNVASGELYDCGAAGITITPERSEKVNFSIPYYTSVQYVIFNKDAAPATKTVDGLEYAVWEALAGKKIGTQLDTTGWIYTDGEINGQESDPDYGYDGVLYGTDTTHTGYDSAQLAADDIGNGVDYVIVDELPAEFIVSKNANLKCVPLYYSGETDADDAPVEENYAICVTKGNDELLTAINEVLTEMLKKDANGLTEIEKLVMKHMGMDE